MQKKEVACGKVSACSAAVQHRVPTGSGRATHQSDRKTRPHFLAAGLPEGCFLSSPDDREEEDEEKERKLKSTIDTHLYGSVGADALLQRSDSGLSELVGVISPFCRALLLMD